MNLSRTFCLRLKHTGRHGAGQIPVMSSVTSSARKKDVHTAPGCPRALGACCGPRAQHVTCPVCQVCPGLGQQVLLAEVRHTPGSSLLLLSCHARCFSVTQERHPGWGTVYDVMSPLQHALSLAACSKALWARIQGREKPRAPSPAGPGSPRHGSALWSSSGRLRSRSGQYSLALGTLDNTLGQTAPGCLCKFVPGASSSWNWLLFQDRECQES